MLSAGAPRAPRAPEKQFYELTLQIEIARFVCFFSYLAPNALSSVYELHFSWISVFCSFPSCVLFLVKLRAVRGQIGGPI